MVEGRRRKGGGEEGGREGGREEGRKRGREEGREGVKKRTRSIWFVCWSWGRSKEEKRRR